MWTPTLADFRKFFRKTFERTFESYFQRVNGKTKTFESPFKNRAESYFSRKSTATEGLQRERTIISHLPIHFQFFEKLIGLLSCPFFPSSIPLFIRTPSEKQRSTPWVAALASQGFRITCECSANVFLCEFQCHFVDDRGGNYQSYMRDPSTSCFSLKISPLSVLPILP